MNVKTIARFEADEIREAAQRGQDCTMNAPYIEGRTATGRATCRCCGKRIARGDQELVFPYSFTDGGSYNSWTAVEIHIHREDCKGATT
jgi:hypothetical protein